MGIYIEPTLHPGGVGAVGGGGRVLRIPSDGDDWIGAKIKTKKIPRTFNNAQKIHGPKINPQREPTDPKLASHTEFPSIKTYQALNDITQQIKTIEKKFA